MRHEMPKEVVKKMAQQEREHLALYEVTPDEQYRTGSPRRLYPKDCFKKAFEYVVDKQFLPDDIKLVHGWYQPFMMDRHSPHGWVELPGEIVFDGVLQRFYKKDGYYYYYHIVKDIEYSCEEMFEVAIAAGGTYGPWHPHIPPRFDSN